MVLLQFTKHLPLPYPCCFAVQDPAVSVSKRSLRNEPDAPHDERLRNTAQCKNGFHRLEQVPEQLERSAGKPHDSVKPFALVRRELAASGATNDGIVMIAGDRCARRQQLYDGRNPEW